MSSDHQPKPQDREQTPLDEATEQVPVDPGKTWVPEDRDSQFLAETEGDPNEPKETQTDENEEKPKFDELGETELEETPPTDFGNYKLLEHVGRGGMGDVYKARDRKLDRIVALKTLKKGTSHFERQVERFIREAKAAGRLDHPNIVPCFEFGEYEGWHYLTMAFVSGDSLFKRLASGPLESQEAAEVTLAIANAVAHAHRQGVIHRDIKPGNVILSDDGRPRLTDFGIAKLVDPTDSPIAPAQLTQVGQALGTPGYMAPEQSHGRRWEVNESTDIYGLGGLLVAALTGHHPGSHDSFETLQQEIPQKLQAICDRCLAYRQQDRYTNAEQLVADLEAFVEGIDRPSAFSSPTEPITGTGSKSDVMVTLPELKIQVSLAKMITIGVLVGVVLLSAVLLGIWSSGVWDREPPPRPGDGSSPRNASRDDGDDGQMPRGPIKSRVDVLAETNFAVDAPGTLPLQPDDDLYVDVTADRLEAYLYLFHINTDGEITWMNDGEPIELDPPDPSDPEPITGTGFKVQASLFDFLPLDREGPAGMMTLILLSRQDPLPEDREDEIYQILADCPERPQPAPMETSVQRFSLHHRDGLRHEATRHPLDEDHPVVMTLEHVLAKLRRHFHDGDILSFAVPEKIEDE